MLTAGARDASPTTFVPLAPSASPPLYRLTVGILEYWCHLAGETSPVAIALCPQCHATGTLVGRTADGGDLLRGCPCGARLAHRYSLLRCIGRGAFSRVYLVRDHWQGRQWAMKVLGRPYERLAAHEAALLLGPLRALPSAPHCQGLLRLPDGRLALLLEHLVPLSCQPDCPPWRALLADCARCLARLHECGLLHGDIKPENIMCTGSDPARPRFKLIDYGNCMSQEQLLLYYGDSGEVASLRYRAPEALVGLRSAMGTALDIWSLGVSLAQLLISHRVHGSKEGPGRHERAHGHLSSVPLFTGVSEEAVLAEIMEVGGPLPDHFGQGARWEALGRPVLRSACASEAPSFWRRWARSNWARLLGTRDGLLADVLTGMLQIDPTERLTARDILQHPCLW